MTLMNIRKIESEKFYQPLINELRENKPLRCALLDGCEICRTYCLECCCGIKDPLAEATGMEVEFYCDRHGWMLTTNIPEINLQPVYPCEKVRTSD